MSIQNTAIDRFLAQSEIRMHRLSPQWHFTDDEIIASMEPLKRTLSPICVPASWDDVKFYMGPNDQIASGYDAIFRMRVDDLAKGTHSEELFMTAMQKSNLGGILFGNIDSRQMLNAEKNNEMPEPFNTVVETVKKELKVTEYFEIDFIFAHPQIGLVQIEVKSSSGLAAAKKQLAKLRHLFTAFCRVVHQDLDAEKQWKNFHAVNIAYIANGNLNHSEIQTDNSDRNATFSDCERLCKYLHEKKKNGKQNYFQDKVFKDFVLFLCGYRQDHQLSDVLCILQIHQLLSSQEFIPVHHWIHLEMPQATKKKLEGIVHECIQCCRPVETTTMSNRITRHIFKHYTDADTESYIDENIGHNFRSEVHLCFEAELRHFINEFLGLKAGQHVNEAAKNLLTQQLRLPERNVMAFEGAVKTLNESLPKCDIDDIAKAGDIAKAVKMIVNHLSKFDAAFDELFPDVIPPCKVHTENMSPPAAANNNRSTDTVIQVEALEETQTAGDFGLFAPDDDLFDSVSEPANDNRSVHSNYSEMTKKRQKAAYDRIYWNAINKSEKEIKICFSECLTQFLTQRPLEDPNMYAKYRRKAEDLHERHNMSINAKEYLHSLQDFGVKHTDIKFAHPGTIYFTPEQLAAIDVFAEDFGDPITYINRKQIITGSPGSGKTLVLLMKLFILKQVRGERRLAFASWFTHLKDVQKYLDDNQCNNGCCRPIELIGAGRAAALNHCYSAIANSPLGMFNAFSRLEAIMEDPRYDVVLDERVEENKLHKMQRFGNVKTGVPDRFNDCISVAVLNTVWHEKINENDLNEFAKTVSKPILTTVFRSTNQIQKYNKEYNESAHNFSGIPPERREFGTAEEAFTGALVRIRQISSVLENIPDTLNKRHLPTEALPTKCCPRESLPKIALIGCFIGFNAQNNIVSYVPYKRYNVFISILFVFFLMIAGVFVESAVIFAATAVLANLLHILMIYRHPLQTYHYFNFTVTEQLLIFGCMLPGFASAIFLPFAFSLALAAFLVVAFFVLRVALSMTGHQPVVEHLPLGHRMVAFCLNCGICILPALYTMMFCFQETPASVAFPTVAMVFVMWLASTRLQRYRIAPYDFFEVPSLEFPIVLIVCEAGKEKDLRKEATRAVCHLIVYRFVKRANFFDRHAFMCELRMLWMAWTTSHKMVAQPF